MVKKPHCDPDTSLHIKILDSVSADLVHTLAHSGITVDDLPVKQLLRKVFRNYRYSNQTQHCGIRLTTLGNQLLRKHYVAYDYTIDRRITNKSLLVLDQQMAWPYYVGNTRVTFYSENDAAWFCLNGNNLEDFVDYI